MSFPALHTVTRGDTGLPILAIHGFGTDHRMMLPLLEPLFGPDRAARRCYVDLPGHGQTPGDAVSSSRDVADALDAWVEQNLGQEPFAVIGQSFGGMLARDVVRRRPEQVVGGAFLVPAVEPDREKRHLASGEPLERDEELLAELEDKTRDQFTENAVRQTRPQFELFSEQLLPGLLAADGEAASRITDDYSLDPIETTPWDRPTLIACGRQDSVVGWRDQLRLLDFYPRATYAVLDGAGHNAHLERADAVRALLADWLGEVLA